MDPSDRFFVLVMRAHATSSGAARDASLEEPYDINHAAPGYRVMAVGMVREVGCCSVSRFSRWAGVIDPEYRKPWPI